MSSEGPPSGPPGVQEKQSRWRRKRPAPAAAKPLILFSLLSALIFTATISVVFIPRIIDSMDLDDIPQFFLAVSMEGSTAIVEVRDATGPRAYELLGVELVAGSERSRVRMSDLPTPVVAFQEGASAGILDRGDRFSVSTEPGRSYLFFVVYLPTGDLVGRAMWST